MTQRAKQNVRSVVLTLVLIGTAAIVLILSGPRRAEPAGGYPPLPAPVRLRSMTDWPAPVWVESPTLIERFGLADRYGLYGDYLWAPTDINTRVSAFDGRTIRRGGAMAGGMASFVIPAGNAAYCQSYQERALVTYSDAACPFTFQQALTQAATGATGVFIRDIATAKQVVIYQTSAANFTTAGVIANNGNTITPTAVTIGAAASTYFLEKSTDGFTAFAPVADVTRASGYGSLTCRSFVDCGVIAGLGKKRLLLMAPYMGAASGVSELLYNIPDDDDEWRSLFTTLTDSIRHFHGLLWCPGLGAGDGRLYVYTGDTNDMSSILFCDDVADLVANGATWKTRWGLDLTGTARTTFLSTGAGAPYCAGAGSQSARTVDLIASTATAAPYLYFLPDTYTTSLVKLHRVNTAAKTIEIVGSKLLTGLGWYGCRQTDGKILLTTDSAYTVGVGYQGSSDAYAHLYAIAPDGLDVVEVAKYLRPDYLALETGDFCVRNLVEFQGYLWISLGGPSSWTPVVGRLLPETEAREYTAAGQTDPINPQGLATVNYAPNPQFSGFYLGDWIPTLSTAARETTKVDHGQTASLKLTPTGAGASYVYYRPPTQVQNALRGNLVTFSCRVLADWASIATQVPRVSVDSLTASITATSSAWQTLSITKYVNQSAAYVTFYLYPRISGAGVDPCYFSDVQIVVGGQRGRPNLVPAAIVQGNRAVVVDGWYQDNVAANQTAAQLARPNSVGSGHANLWVAPRGGIVQAVAVRSSEARTAGSCTVTVYKNAATTYLLAVLNATDTTFAFGQGTIDDTAYQVAPGDRLDVRVTTSADWAPVTADITASVEVLQ